LRQDSNASVSSSCVAAQGPSASTSQVVITARGRVYRFVEQLGDGRENLQASVDHMNAGGFWVSVPAHDADKVTAAGILGRHEAHDMVHYGQYHHERLGS
jgi:hypothetical protein